MLLSHIELLAKRGSIALKNHKKARDCYVQFHKGRRQLVLGFLLTFMMMKMVLMIMLQSGTEEPSLLTTSNSIL